MFSQILFLFLINVLSAIGYSLIAPLYPEVADQKEVDKFLIGIIFSFYAISNIIAIPLTPWLINRVGRRKLFYIAMIIEGSCTIIFAMVNRIDSKGLFVFLSILARFSQGIASALSSTLVYSTAASICDQENMKTTMGYMELAYSVGLTIGPLVGSFLYYLNGYSFPFYVCGIFTFLCLFFINKLEIVDEVYDVPHFIKILLNKDILPTIIAIIVDMMSGTFIYPVFTNHLLVKFALDVETSSIFFVISMIFYFFTLQFLNKISNRIGVKLTICIGLSINFFAVFLISPAPFLPQSIWTIILGLIVLGITGAFVTVPGIVDFMDTLKEQEGMDENVANDVASGEAFGPFCGGLITNYYSFDHSCYFISFISLLTAAWYYSCNSKHIKEQLNIVTPKEDEDYVEMKFSATPTKIRSNRGSIDKFSHIGRNRAYSHSSKLSSKRSSINF